MNRNLQAVFVGKALLRLKNIQRFCQQLFISDILLFVFPLKLHPYYISFRSKLQS